MCGVVGIWQFKSQIDHNTIEKSAQKLNNRGPDSEGIFFSNDRRLALAHKRLSIIDLSEKASQPMAENGYTIVFNGEIYNFKEIKQELKKEGFNFFSNSDTEVVLKAYQKWQEDSLEKLRGMFAFAIWDEKKNELFLARDRFGIKPLYFYKDKEKFIFASEIKAILASGLVKKEVDFRTVEEFLRLGYVADIQTIYKGIVSLEAGCYLKVREETFEKNKFFDIKSYFEKKPLKIKKEQVIPYLRKELTESVKMHLISDVEVGIFLSGGIDSSALVSLARKAGKSDIKTISVVFPEKGYDERKFAQEVAKHYKTNHVEAELKAEDIKESIDSFFEAIDQPTVDGLNSYLISKIAKKAGLKVVLSGLGADEIFGGYSSFQKVQLFYVLGNILRTFPKNFIKNLPFLPKKEKIISAFEVKKFSLLKAYLIYRGLFNGKQIEGIFSDNLKYEIFGNFALDRFLVPETGEIKGNFNKISFLEIAFYMKDQLLRDADVFSMANSLELRVPFVDNRVVELVSRLPQTYKAGEPKKRLLILATGDLPEQVYQRKKMGFTFPLAIWLKNELKEIVETEIKQQKIFDSEYTGKLLESFYNGKLHWSRIWSLYVLSRFLNKA